MILETLYHLDNKGKTRVWQIDVVGDHYRTISGIMGGEMVTSLWKRAHGKNIGKSNQTTGDEQALLEAKSAIKKKLETKYVRDLAKINVVHYFRPMLAEKWEDHKDKLQYPVYVQPKLDGIRCIATKDGLFSRNGKPIVAVPHVRDALEYFFEQLPHVILDGELYNHDLHDNFDKIVSLVRKTKPTRDDLAESEDKVQYHVYDAISANDTRACYLDRMLRYQPRIMSGIIHIVPSTVAASESEVLEQYAKMLEQGYEGAMIRADAPYENKRTKNLLKLKSFQDAEYPVVALEEGQGNWSGMAKAVVCRLPDGRTFSAGIAGTEAEMSKLLHGPVPCEVTVRFQNLTPDGIPRFPVAKAFYYTKRDM